MADEEEHGARSNPGIAAGGEGGRGSTGDMDGAEQDTQESPSTEVQDHGPGALEVLGEVRDKVGQQMAVTFDVITLSGCCVQRSLARTDEGPQSREGQGPGRAGSAAAGQVLLTTAKTKAGREGAEGRETCPRPPPRVTRAR